MKKLIIIIIISICTTSFNATRGMENNEFADESTPAATHDFVTRQYETATSLLDKESEKSIWQVAISTTQNSTWNQILGSQTLRSQYPWNFVLCAQKVVNNQDQAIDLKALKNTKSHQWAKTILHFFDNQGNWKYKDMTVQEFFDQAMSLKNKMDFRPISTTPSSTSTGEKPKVISTTSLISEEKPNSASISDYIKSIFSKSYTAPAFIFAAFTLGYEVLIKILNIRSMPSLWEKIKNRFQKEKVEKESVSS